MPNNRSADSIFTSQVSPVVLAILDGWGHRQESVHNAINNAKTPVMDALWHAYPHTLIEASGADVGLPDSQMGNSEVGHLTIGAGRVIQQELVRISNTVKTGKIGQTPALKELAKNIQNKEGTLHLLGLCSDGGVHSHIDHLCGLLEWAASKNFAKVVLHAITDGRDTPAKSALSYLTLIQEKLKDCGIGEIGSICGRYWAMDRDNRWERTSKAYELLTNPNIKVATSSPKEILNTSYVEEITDEFLEPIRLSPEYLKEGDGLIVFNFRPDRARQLVQALTIDSFNNFKRTNRPKIDLVTFTQYEASLPVSVAFPPEPLDHLLGHVIAEHGLKQYRTAETEKYPHVTYFLNGGQEKPLPGEDRHLVPSPRVATYDLSPSMSADSLTESCVNAIKTGTYSLIVINYANPDMVGHTGIMEATVEAIEKVDSCIGRILSATGQMSGTLMITADHGNAELMQGPDGEAWTAHTTNPVPVILIEGEKRKISGQGNGVELREGGGLADIAPTLLEILNLPKPDAMTGASLIKSIRSKPTPSRMAQPV